MHFSSEIEMTLSKLSTVLLWKW